METLESLYLCRYYSHWNVFYKQQYSMVLPVIQSYSPCFTFLFLYFRRYYSHWNVFYKQQYSMVTPVLQSYRPCFQVWYIVINLLFHVVCGIRSQKFTHYNSFLFLMWENDLDIHSLSPLKQPSTDRHFVQLAHLLLILSQPVS